jgi:hypothetical protein
MPLVDACAIEQRGRHHPKTRRQSTRSPPQQQRQPNAITAPGGQRARRGGGKEPPTPQRRCHLSTRRPLSNAADTTRQRVGHQRGLLSNSDNRTQSRRQGDNERGGGARSRPRPDADATCRPVGHRATQPTPSVDARAINVVSSARATTERNRGARGTTSAGGGKGPPMPRRRCHLLTRGPSFNT